MIYIFKDHLSTEQAKSLPIHKVRRFSNQRVLPAKKAYRKMANRAQPEMSGERYYLILIAEEIEKAYKPGETFRKESIDYVNKRFRFNYGPIFSDRCLKSRFKTLKKKYQEFSEVLSHDGITWDSRNNILRGNHNLLKEKYKYSPVHDGYLYGEANFDYMCRVFESGVQFEL